MTRIIAAAVLLLTLGTIAAVQPAPGVQAAGLALVMAGVCLATAPVEVAIGRLVRTWTS